MTVVKMRIHVGPDGTLSGQAHGLPAGEHEAEITLLDTGSPRVRPSAEELLARVRAIQAEVAQLPVFDSRSLEEILGYNERGYFDDGH
jgi:hypothetical protein